MAVGYVALSRRARRRRGLTGLSKPSALSRPLGRVDGFRPPRRRRDALVACLLSCHRRVPYAVDAMRRMLSYAVAVSHSIKRDAA